MSVKDRATFRFQPTADRWPRILATRVDTLGLVGYVVQHIATEPARPATVLFGDLDISPTSLGQSFQSHVFADSLSTCGQAENRKGEQAENQCPAHSNLRVRCCLRLLTIAHMVVLVKLNCYHRHMTKGRIKQVQLKYSRYLVPGMLVAGLIVDYITFRTIKISTAFTILGVYLILAGCVIAYKNFYDAGQIRSKLRILRYLRLISPLIVQFTFGALLSASLIFYWFSGTISVSWPFLIIVALLIMSNDVLRDHYLKPVVQISVFYFVLFSYATLVLPFLMNSIQVWIFLLAGLISLIVIYVYVRILSQRLDHLAKIKQHLRNSILIIFLIINSLYFLNIIPPIPLSLRSADMAHSLSRSNGGYVLGVEEENWFEQLVPGQTLHHRPGQSLYAFSTIFAPADLDTTIVHNWQYYDADTWQWVDSSRLSFSISGGSDQGYRGYSVTSKLHQGKWRVSVETERGQVLGRIGFRIKETTKQSNLVEVIK